jgi:hypothetical protein
MIHQNDTHKIDDIKLRFTSKALIILLNSIGDNFYLGKEISRRERGDDIPEESPSPTKARDSVGQVSDDDDIGDDEDSKVSVV